MIVVHGATKSAGCPLLDASGHWVVAVDQAQTVSDADRTGPLAGDALA
jgi:hypothetical protein